MQLSFKMGNLPRLQGSVMEQLPSYLESKRQTMNADDVFKALEEIEFPDEFIGPLKISLNEYKRKNGGNKLGLPQTKEAQKKRKAEGEPSRKSGGKSTPKKESTTEK